MQERVLAQLVLASLAASSGRQAIIAESLEDGKRIPVPTSVRVSSLDEISMFTTGDDEPLKNILTKLYEKNKDKALFCDPPEERDNKEADQDS